MREQLTVYLRDRAKMEKRVPLNVHIGMYTLNCEPVRNALAAKYADLGNLVLELMAKKTRAICDEIQKQYDMMVGTIKKAAQTVEDVSQTREYISKKVPELMLEVRSTMIATAMRGPHSMHDYWHR